ncbi:MAG: HEPN domain-containing protein [Elusimicrobia bacterium]|nr:HEPN domain-containing protein [Elusimicrobiota bacterium]
MFKFGKHDQFDTWLSRLQEIAYHDWLCARLTLNLGYYKQANWMISQSMEKYMKVLWAKDRKFKSVNELKERLKSLSKNHDLHDIFISLDKNYRDALGKYKVSFYVPSALRYGEYNYGLGFSNKMFKECENFIRQIRVWLSDVPSGSILDDYNRTIHVFSTVKHKKAIELIKGILSLVRRMPTKKERKEVKRILNFL